MHVNKDVQILKLSGFNLKINVLTVHNYSDLIVLHVHKHVQIFKKIILKHLFIIKKACYS